MKNVSLLLSVVALWAAPGCGANGQAGDSPRPSSPQDDSAVALAPRDANAGAFSQGASAPADYFPLSVGRRWLYDVSYTVPLQGTSKTTAVIEVQSSREIDGKTFYKVVSTVKNTSLIPTNVDYLRHKTDGVYRAIGKDEAEGEILFLPARLEPGTKWTMEIPTGGLFGKVTSQSKVAAREAVQHKDVTYQNCVKITSEAKTGLGKVGTVQQEQWLAPGVGLVKQSQRSSLWSMEMVLRKVEK
jgi:hypothetical protein